MWFTPPLTSLPFANGLDSLYELPPPLQVSKGRDTGVSQVTGFTAKISMGNGMQVRITSQKGYTVLLCCSLYMASPSVVVVRLPLLFFSSSCTMKPRLAVYQYRVQQWRVRQVLLSMLVHAQ